MRTLDGQKKTLKDFTNKVTLVNFFFPRCPYCNVELPEVQKIYDKYKDKGLSAVWINILPEELRTWIAGWQMTKNLQCSRVNWWVARRFTTKDYAITSTPATYLLGQSGQIIYHRDGYVAGDEKTLESKIEEALGQASPLRASLNDSAPQVTCR